MHSKKTDLNFAQYRHFTTGFRNYLCNDTLNHLSKHQLESTINLSNPIIIESMKYFVFLHRGLPFLHYFYFLIHVDYF
jgi:hypothetical protein